MYFLSNQRSIFKLKVYVLSFLFICVISNVGFTATSRKINYQGRLMENGAPVGDSIPVQKPLTFKLFDAESGGTELWSSGPQIVTVSKGLFNYVLGSNVPLNINWESGGIYLEITVDGTVLSPREEITNAGYAFLAENVVDGAITTDDIATNAVDSTKIADGSVTSADVANNSLTVSDLATNIVSSVDGVVNDGGNVDLVAGSNITITPDDTADTITISATGAGSGDITGVTAGDGLTGGGVSGDVALGIGAGDGINVAANSISATLGTSIDSSEIVNESVTSADVANNSLTASDLATNIVSSVDGVVNDGGNVDLVAGSNITITPDDTADTITISATGGLSTDSISDTDGNTVVQTEESANEDKIRFDTAGVERMIIDDVGNVGIGTTAPIDRLHLHKGGSGQVTYMRITNDFTGATDTDGLMIGVNAYGNAFVQNYESGNLILRAGGGVGQIMIDQDGSVGIGNDLSPDAKLEIIKPASGDILNITSSSDGDLVTILNNGNVGIGTTSPDYKLDISAGNAGPLRALNVSKVLTSGTLNTYAIYAECESTNSADHYAISALATGDKSGTAWKTGVTGLATGIANANIGIYGSASGATTNWAGYFKDGNVYIKNNVGIGTQSPSGDFEVRRDNSACQGLFRSTDNSSGAMVNARNSIGAQLGIFSYGTAMPFTYLGTAMAGGTMLCSTGASKLAIGTQTDAPLYLSTDNNVRMTILSTGRVGIGTTSPNYLLHVNGSFAATAKNFDIPDPRYKDENRRLIHSTLEGPEHGLYYRGEARLTDGTTTIELPDYFEALAREEERTVLLTAKNSWSPLYVEGNIEDGKFIVKTTDYGNQEQEFYWEVMTIRKDIDLLQVEITREE